MPEQCSPGDNVVTIPKPKQIPTISADATAALAIYNYSLQNVISRSLKFVASYYDWLYCQIGLYQYHNETNQATEASYTGPPQRFTEGGDTNTTHQRLPSREDPDAISLGVNAGNEYTPPASLFAQVAQVLGWADTTFSQVDLSQCVCNNLCQFIQMLVNIEGNSIIRDFIKESTFNNSNSSYQPTYLGCGNLYDEGQLVDFGEQVISIIDLMVAVLQNLGVNDDAEQGEALLQKLCLCLARAASGGTCGVAKGYCDNPIGNFTNIPPFSSGENPANYNCCPDLDAGIIEALAAGDPLPPNSAYSRAVVNYNSQIYRQQFFTMFVDLLQFVLFDRDCNPDKFKRDGSCAPCCPQPPSQEDWLKARCRIGTGNGNCVVCSGACSGYRRVDHFKPLVSSLLAVKHAISLITLDRSDPLDPKLPTYNDQVGAIYNAIVSDYTKLYSDDKSDKLVFHPDCAAPQFCCSTQLAAEKCAYNCCTGSCERVAGCCLFPIPVIDNRKASWCCGEGVPYHPSLGQWVNPLCFDTEGGSLTDTEEQEENIRYDCFSNPCVIMPYCCNSITCDKSCCDNNGHPTECDFFATH